MVGAGLAALERNAPARCAPQLPDASSDEGVVACTWRHTRGEEQPRSPPTPKERMVGAHEAPAGPAAPKDAHPPTEELTWHREGRVGPQVCIEIAACASREGAATQRKGSVAVAVHSLPLPLDTHAHAALCHHCNCSCSRRRVQVLPCCRVWEHIVRGV